MSKYIFLSLFLLLAGCGPQWDIRNPYEGVDWVNHTQHKANFHTHTTISDGRMSPQRVVEEYHKLGYGILSITDHNTVSYPWTEFTLKRRGDHYERAARTRVERGQLDVNELEFENRDPDTIGMIAVPGSELSSPNHLGSFFNMYDNDEFGDYVTQRKLVNDSFSVAELTDYHIEILDRTAAEDGLVMWYHPTRSRPWEAEKERVAKITDDPVGWYVDHYRRYDHLIGQEIYNDGDSYPEDRELWDGVLARLMPDRPVWGFSNDDMHVLSSVGRNWNVFILPELSTEWARRGMEEGRFYFVYAPEGHDGPSPPVIESIDVNERRGTIEIQGSGYESVRWISGGEVVQEGNILRLQDLPETIRYVRAELSGAGESVVGTQPFGVARR